MKNIYWTQIDVLCNGYSSRFLMQDCGGRDQVAMTVLAGDWYAYEYPLPTLVAKLCLSLEPVFIDVGANTGFYSLLAASCKAKRVHSFEPVPFIRDILNDNISASEYIPKIKVYPYAISNRTGVEKIFIPSDKHGLIETSASLNPEFRIDKKESISVDVKPLDSFLDFSEIHYPQRTLLKVDVESTEADVLSGGSQLISKLRPFIAIELLPGVDLQFFNSFLLSNQYTGFHLRPNGDIPATKVISDLSMSHRDHLLVPDEALDYFIDTINS